MMTAIRTILTVLRPDREPEIQVISMSAEPSLDELKGVLEVLLDGAGIEHVSVLHDGERADMFVDEMSVVNGLPRNEAATKIYRHNWLSRHPETEPETLPVICGPAVLFDRIVWR